MYTSISSLFVTWFGSNSFRLESVRTKSFSVLRYYVDGKLIASHCGAIYLNNCYRREYASFYRALSRFAKRRGYSIVRFDFNDK